MTIKCTILGLAIYATMGLYLVAAVLFLARVRRVGYVVYGVGCAVAVAAWVYRWGETGHAPLQNMFEVCLTLGMLMFPISLFCRAVLGVGGEGLDPVIALVLFLIPAGFVLDAEPKMLMPALQSVLFIPHVSVYMLSYAILIKAGVVPAILTLIGCRQSPEAGLMPWETATYRMVSLGFPLLTLGLVLGAVWGKIAWGDYWNWDPKELWSLVSWLVYVGYLHFRSMYGGKHPRVNAALAMTGFVAITTTLFWVNFARIFGGGLHSYA